MSFSSESSIMRKPDETSSDRTFSLIRSKQNECMVEIFADGIRACWLKSHSFEGSASSCFAIASERRCFICAAASLVNVTTIILSAGTRFSLSERIRSSLSTRTEVLPLPAAAETMTDVSLASIASSCRSVHLSAIVHLSFPVFFTNNIVKLCTHFLGSFGVVITLDNIREIAADGAVIAV